MRGEAVFGGPGNIYRYTLLRFFGTGSGRLLFVMLNPSTATAEVSDPTVTRCEGYARAWGFAELMVANIFALRSTDPKVLKTHPDPIGPENDEYLVSAAKSAAYIVAGWGTHGKLLGRGAYVRGLLSRFDLRCLTQTKDGHPGHPLYLKASLKPVSYAS